MPSDPLSQPLQRVGCSAHVHAVTLDGDRETGHRADEPVMPASVIKLLLALVVEDRIAAGKLDGRLRLRLGEVERTPGPVGLSLFADDADLSLRDAVTLMLTISDNVVADALLGLVGAAAVAETAGRTGMSGTRMDCDLRTLIATRDVSADGPISTTARDQTMLLRAIWDDTAAPPSACERVRWAMERQLSRDRLAAGFGTGTEVAAKSGGFLGVWRNEVGVVRFADGTAYAVAVFARADRPPLDPFSVNAAIGEAAVAAVDALRD